MQATFTVLGIAPTRDTKAIRRAYAQRLKVLDQHTQADEFEALRAAYETAMRWAAHADASGQPPGAPGPAPSPAATSGYALRQPPQVMRQVEPDATWRALRKRQKIIDQAIAELMRTEPRDLPAAWQRLNAHPALESLDASAELGDRLLDRIAQHPDGQHALYTLGQQHFHWEQASYRPRTPRAAQWLQRYIEERELWARQPVKQRLHHERAIERMRRHPSPNWRQARRAHATIYHVSRHMPAWWNLHVPAALHEQHARVLQSPPRWVRGIRRLRDMQSRWPVWLVWICVGVLAHGLYLWLTPATPPTAPQASAPLRPAAASQLRPVDNPSGNRRSYLLTGPVAAGNPNGEVLLDMPAPAYPPDAAGAQGTVQIALTLAVDGKVRAAVSQSSGDPRLDAAALAAAQATRVAGKLAYPFHVRVPFRFQMRD